MDNYYEILHVANFAEIEVVRAAYKAMVKLYHPDADKNADSLYVIKLNLAYEVLGDDLKKRDYDVRLRQYLGVNVNLKRARGNCGEKDEKVNQNNSVNEETVNEKNTHKEKEVGRFTQKVTRALGYIAHSFVESINARQKEYEDAYIQGQNWSDDFLVRKYLKSKGTERLGYLKVLEERELVYVKEGKIITSDKFRKLSGK